MRAKITIPDKFVRFFEREPTLSGLSISDAVQHLILTNPLWLDYISWEPNTTVVEGGAPVIETGVPIPEIEVSDVPGLIRSLEPGQSCMIRRDMNSVSPYCAYYKRKHGRKFTVRTVEPGIVRVWRVE